MKMNEKHLWDQFKGHHYMAHNLPPCKFFTFYLVKDDKEILFACLGTLLQVNKLPSKRVTRFVILPEFQGLGLSRRVLDAVGQYYHDSKYLLYIVTFHPRLGSLFESSPNWIPTINNQKEYKSTQEVLDGHTASNNLRAGTKMFRYRFSPDTKGEAVEYTLINDILNENLDVTQLRDRQIRENLERDEVLKEREKIRQKVKAKKEAELDKQMVPDEEFKNATASLNNLFKRSKRKVKKREKGTNAKN